MTFAARAEGFDKLRELAARLRGHGAALPASAVPRVVAYIESSTRAQLARVERTGTSLATLAVRGDASSIVTTLAGYYRFIPSRKNGHAKWAWAKGIPGHVLRRARAIFTEEHLRLLGGA